MEPTQLGNPLSIIQRGSDHEPELVCRGCGRPSVTLYCSVCVEISRDERIAREQEETQELYRREADRLERYWETLCPPLYNLTDPARLPQKQYRETMAWQSGDTGLMLIGATGGGKTRCLYQLLHRLVLCENHQAVVFNCVSFGHECARRFMGDPGETAQWLERLATVDLLVLDDLGKAKFTERVESELYGVIEARTANMLPILATSNFTGRAFAAKLTEDRGLPMIRRLREFCKVIVF